MSTDSPSHHCFCPDCGAELIGEVNGCWNCGRVIRPQELAAQSRVDTAVGDSATEDASNSASPDQQTPSMSLPSPLTDEEPLMDLAPSEASPFAAVEVPRAVRVPGYRNPYLGQVCGWSALAVAAMACLIAAWFPIGGVILAIMSLVVAVIGVRSKPRHCSLAMLLAILSLIIAGTSVALERYLTEYGHYPWQDEPSEPALPFPGEEEDFDEWQ